jgi:transcriptional regulator GlxA family with amidase domain
LTLVEHLEEFRKRFPAFQLEDELFVQVGRNVMTGILGA